jgi:hypothetical protein
MQLVYVEHSFDRSEDPGQKAKVAAGHSDQLCDDCSRLFICSLSASSTMMSVVGSGMAFLRASLLFD